ncbi:uncharacterized protein C18orf19 homolog A [Contarinia nasturtii]|uniref:uncharacterized protein C18orf19 homolog A n=1 Tax=Contarinia nasturtii TaxID=265458 RepID=UPI0012D3B86C|nr:uncharacterized protein C18orf19 homolog A [Contarinia nasturtii]
MNTSTVRSLFKYGYSWCAKDVIVHPSTSRILCNYPANRNYSTPWPRRSQQHLFTIDFKQWNLSNTFSTFEYRHFSTSLPHNSQTALNPKSPDHGEDEKPQKKKIEKSIVDDKVENQPHGENQTDNVADKTETVPQTEEKLSLMARFKKMYKEYWYVLLPVHCVTSCFWFGSFYYLSSSGVDIPSMLESLHFSETAIANLRDSSLGHVAIAYLCYKIATPIRYTVTLGGTTLAIKYLSQWGYIRPVPNRTQLKQIYDDQKAKFQKKE